MRKTNLLPLLVIVLSLTLNACGLLSPSSISPSKSTQTSASPTLTPSSMNSVPDSATPFILTPTPIALPQGSSIVVTNTSDGGPGSLRQALLDAQDGNTITFDPAVFPPDAPATIHVDSGELPHIHVSNLTLDASNAGVILDGSQIPDEWVAGLQIVSSEGNKIMGFQISHFPGPGIAISGESKHNVIGGDRGVGAGPYGQGNLLSNNMIGVDLSTEGTTLNTVTGNLIGTDAEGTEGLGNERDEISITEGTHDNTIDPSNIIANNGVYGINDENLKEYELASPLIFDHDLTAGSVTGTACPGCIVEIFSTSGNEGEIFEAQTVADGNGVFTFYEGVPFMGPNLRAKATDPYGISSPFSWPPTLGITGSLLLQQANDFPRMQLKTKPSGELVDNHIGIWFEDYGRYYDTDFVYRNGFKRIRLGSLAGEGQRWITIINAETLSDKVDQKITDYANEGMKIVLILASGSGIPFADGIFQTEQDFEQYIEFVGFVVSHFKGRIYAYEIWNEPGHMRPGVYADLVERVVPVIREGDEDAKIIIGAIQGDWNNGYPGYGEYQRFTVDIRYLNELLQSGVVHLVDGISWHPFYDNVPSDPYYQEYPELVQGIKDLATSNGFTGEYFADEIFWQTVDEENWDNGPPVSPLIAAKYYIRTITEHRGLGINVTINTFFQVPFMEPIHNICDSLAGAEPAHLALSLETSDDTNLRQYTFSLPDGDKLVALWRNNNAVEEDSGIETKVTIPGASASKVIGVDVLYGFEQELNFEMVNGNLVIRNLLVGDYPILIRFTDTNTP
jgi:hypothetical protein